MRNPRPSWRNIETAFVPGNLQTADNQTTLPLERYLPPYTEGMASRWLNNYASPGSWVLDPFGQSPYSVLELARTGYRVLVTANNPIAAFILEVLAAAPSLNDMQSALKLLGSLQYSNSQNLEQQIRSHYQLKCPKTECSQALNTDSKAHFEVERYIWNENESEPSFAIGKCDLCGFEGEIQLTQEQIESLPPLPSINLSRARALEKIDPRDTQLRAVMRDVTTYYTDRSMSLLQTILNRIANPTIPARQKAYIHALFLSAADRCNQLWSYPIGRNRPRQLSRPPVYQEYNLWLALEEACHQWSVMTEPITFRYWPEKLPQSGGVCLFSGRLRECSPLPEPDLIDIVYSNLPRRNQAWWNLSGLWSAWLWGREGIKTLRNSLLKQRYDWTWHATALEKVFSRLKYMVRPSTPILMQISELDPLFLLAGTKAAQYAGFSLRTAAASGNLNVLQTVWKFAPTQSNKVDNRRLQENARQIARSFLTVRGEPSAYLRLFTQMILTLQTQGMLFQDEYSQFTPPINKLIEDLDPVFTDQNLFIRYNPGVSTDSGSYWLRRPPENYIALADSVESLIRQQFLYLNRQSAIDINTAIFSGHPGLLTPDDELIQTILRSYANEELINGESYWILKENENFATRMMDIKALHEMIEKMASQLKLKRQLTEEAIYYLDEHDNELYTFFITGSAIISETLQRYKGLSGKKLIVLPGSRANLISYKLRRDPSLQALLSDDWHFVKFRHIRNLHNNPFLNLTLFESQIFGDPPEFLASQLVLF